MAIEAKDLLSYLGLDTLDPTKATMDEVRAAFDPRFILRDKAAEDEAIRTAVAGTVVKSAATEIKRVAKHNGIELNTDETGKPLQDLAALVLTRQSEMFNSKIEELNKKITAPNDALKDLEDKFKRAQERADAEATAKAQLAEQLTAKDKEVADFKRGYKLGQVKETLFKSLPFSDTATDLVKRGFNSYIAEKYVIDLNDKDEPIIKDRTGAFIPDPSKNGYHLSPEAVLAKELAEQKLNKVVDTSKQNQQQQQQHQQQYKANEAHTPSGTRQVHPRALQGA